MTAPAPAALAPRRDVATLLWRAAGLLRARWSLRGCALGHGVWLGGRARVEPRGRLILGDHVQLFAGIVPSELLCGRNAELCIGSRCILNYGVSIDAAVSVRIGCDSQLGSMVRIRDSDGQKTAPVVIGSGVWLAHGVLVEPGARIGDGAIVLGRERGGRRGAGPLARFRQPGALGPARVLCAGGQRLMRVLHGAWGVGLAPLSRAPHDRAESRDASPGFQRHCTPERAPLVKVRAAHAAAGQAARAGRGGRGAPRAAAPRRPRRAPRPPAGVGLRGPRRLRRLAGQLGAAALLRAGARLARTHRRSGRGGLARARRRRAGPAGRAALPCARARAGSAGDPRPAPPAGPRRAVRGDPAAAARSRPRSARADPRHRAAGRRDRGDDAQQAAHLGARAPALAERALRLPGRRADHQRQPRGGAAQGADRRGLHRRRFRKPRRRRRSRRCALARRWASTSRCPPGACGSTAGSPPTSTTSTTATCTSTATTRAPSGASRSSTSSISSLPRSRSASSRRFCSWSQRW